MDDSEDTEANYRAHLAYLISRTKSRGGTRYFNQYVNRCRAQAAADYPQGAAEANRKDGQLGGCLGIFGALFGLFS